MEGPNRMKSLPIGGERCGQFLLHASSGFEPSTYPLLNSTVWGTTEIKYWVRDIEKVTRPHPYSDQIEQYIASPVSDEEEVAGTYLLFPKRLRIGKETVSAFFGTLFSVAPKFGGKGLGRAILDNSVRISNERHHNQSRLDYAFIEKTNVSSFRAFLAAGYESLATFHALTFSRTFTRSDPRVESLSEGDRETLIGLLSDFYADHVMTDFETSVLPKCSRVIRNASGEIVAGVQSIPHHWEIKKLAGLSGWFSLNVLTQVPFLRRQIQRDLHFLRFGNLYFRPGHEEDLQRLMIHSLHEHKIHTGMVYLDRRSRMYSVLKENQLGLLNSLAGENPAELMMHPAGLLPQWRSLIQAGPVYISVIDD